jgi:hypothetical protein
MAQVVASSLIAATLTRKTARLEILGVASRLVWLAMDGHAVTIQTVRPGSRLALPTSIFVTDLGSTRNQVSLQNGLLALGGDPVKATRWWQPPRAPVLSTCISFSQAPVPGRLLGRGSGLTPEGDDILAGWLIAARSINHPDFETVFAEVSKTARTMTTTFSACLLDCAGAGYGVAPLIDYLNARLANSKTVLSKREMLTRVGHTSGEALAMGVDLALGQGDLEIAFSEVSNKERAIA